MNKILITGAATGIGFDTAIALSQKGYQVIATAKSQEYLKNLQALSIKEDLKIKFDNIDVRLESDLQKISIHKPDILINNAAIGESGPVSEIPMDRVRNNFDTNLHGVIRGSQIACKYMIPQGHGRIIIIGSIADSMTVPFNGAYHMTKHALEALSDGLRQELEPKGIFVSLIKPGKINTGFNQKMAATKHEWLNENSAFSNMIKKLKESDKKMWEGGVTTKSVVKTIIKAVESSKPKSRYVTPSKYGLMMPLLHIFPDRVFDRIMRRIMGL